MKFNSRLLVKSFSTSLLVGMAVGLDNIYRAERPDFSFLLPVWSPLLDSSAHRMYSAPCYLFSYFLIYQKSQTAFARTLHLKQAHRALPCPKTSYSHPRPPTTSKANKKTQNTSSPITNPYSQKLLRTMGK